MDGRISPEEGKDNADGEAVLPLPMVGNGGSVRGGGVAANPAEVEGSGEARPATPGVGGTARVCAPEAIRAFCWAIISGEMRIPPFRNNREREGSAAI